MASKDQSFDELLGGLVRRVEQQVHAPNINRYVPLPEQDRFHQSTAKGRILFGGNRGGKTFGGIADDVKILTRKHEHRGHLYPDTAPIRMRFIGVDYLEGVEQIALPLFSRLIPASFLINGNWEDSYRPSSRILTLNDKSTVSFMSYEQAPNKFQGVSLHHIHFDEEPPQAIFKESMLRLLDTAGSWTLSETPVQQLEWVQDELLEPAKEGLRPDIEIFTLDTRDNVNLSAKEVADLEATLSVEDRLVRLAGQYKSGSMVFPNFERKYPYVIPREAFRLTTEHRIYESMDWGMVNPSAWLWTAVHPDGSIVTFECLYAKQIVVSEWAKLIQDMRQRICAGAGITLQQYMNQLGGTFGDPAIGDGGNSSAQTGITIQQAFSLAGVSISTQGIREARAGNQNIGLDKIHTYLRLRPASHPRGPLPWWQMTDNCTPLIDEVKKARKPRQSAQQKEIKNESEQIRDKDNHAIDAAKYLFVVTHDLRPAEYAIEDDGAYKEMGRELNAVPTQWDTHDDAFATTMLSGRGQWAVYGSDSYAALED